LLDIGKAFAALKLCDLDRGSDQIHLSASVGDGIADGAQLDFSDSSKLTDGAMLASSLVTTGTNWMVGRTKRGTGSCCAAGT
jgi:hypothetical protein